MRHGFNLLFVTVYSSHARPGLILGQMMVCRIMAYEQRHILDFFQTKNQGSCDKCLY